jgi:hypothetical protein
MLEKGLVNNAMAFEFFDVDHDTGRGLHSSTFQLNLSALYAIGGARTGCVARGGMLWGV